MIANLLTVFLLIVSAAWTDAAATNKGLPRFVGIDPHTLTCDPHGHEFLLLPHYTDCDKYFVCNHGIEKEKNCASPLIFDFEQQACNWQWATQCWLRNKEDIDDSGSGSGDGEDLDWAWNEPTVAGKPVQVPQFKNELECSNVQSASIRMAYEKDCQRYWHCANGVAQTAYCTDGLFFNTIKQQCDFEANVKCEVAEELGEEFMVLKN